MEGKALPCFLSSSAKASDHLPLTSRPLGFLCKGHVWCPLLSIRPQTAGKECSPLPPSLWESLALKPRALPLPAPGEGLARLSTGRQAQHMPLGASPGLALVLRGGGGCPLSHQPLPSKQPSARLRPLEQRLPLGQGPPATCCGASGRSHSRRKPCFQDLRENDEPRKLFEAPQALPFKVSIHSGMKWGYSKETSALFIPLPGLLRSGSCEGRSWSSRLAPASSVRALPA